jgi:hypothetical protein
MSFHPVGLKKEDLAAGGRIFQGDGGHYLRVPGLKRVERVRVGGMELPPVMEFEVPVDVVGEQVTRTKYQEPTYRLDYDNEGTLLLRNICSNDGVWQDGAEVIVWGEWEDEKPPKKGLLGRN